MNSGYLDCSKKLLIGIAQLCTALCISSLFAALSRASSNLETCNSLFLNSNQSDSLQNSMQAQVIANAETASLITQAIQQYKRLIFRVAKLNQAPGTNPSLIAALDSEIAIRKTELLSRGIDKSSLVLTLEDRQAFSAEAELMTAESVKDEQDASTQNQSIMEDQNLVEWVVDQTLTGHTDWVTSLDFSRTGKFLATASIDSTVRVWDVAKGQELSKLEQAGRFFFLCELLSR